jgi:GNAT superfamily N-acetyltransferase
MNPLSQEYEMYSLRTAIELSPSLALSQPIQAAKEFLSTIDHDETGTSLWTWVLENSIEAFLTSKVTHIFKANSTLYDTLFLSPRAPHKRAIGTISIIKDDAGWQRKYNLGGCWLSGLHIDPDYRGYGLAGLLLDTALANLQAAASTSQLGIPVNIVTKDPILIQMATNRHFTIHKNLKLKEQDLGRHCYFRVFAKTAKSPCIQKAS